MVMRRMLENIDLVAITVWIIGIAASAGIFLILFWKYVKIEDRTKAQLAFCLMFLSLAIGRAFLMYADYFLVNLVPDDYIYHIEIWKLANLFQLLGLGFLILVSDYAVFKGKDYYLFSIGFAIVVTVSMLLTDFYVVQLVATSAVAFAAFIPISWIYIGYKLPQTRRKSMLIFLGFLIFGGGLILLSINIAGGLPISIHEIYLTSAVLQLLGLIIMGIGVKRLYFLG